MRAKPSMMRSSTDTRELRERASTAITRRLDGILFQTCDALQKGKDSHSRGKNLLDVGHALSRESLNLKK